MSEEGLSKKPQDESKASNADPEKLVRKAAILAAAGGILEKGLEKINCRHHGKDENGLRSGPTSLV